MPSVTINMPPLHPGQQRIYNDPHRHQLVCAGRRYGKTALAAIMGIESALRGGTAWWIAPNGKHPSATASWALTKRLMKEVPFVQLRENGDKHQLIVPSNDGILEWRSADNPDNLRGEGLDFAVLDEADFMNVDVWLALRPALGDKNGRAFIASTPNRENGWFHNLFKRGQLKDEKEWKSWQCPTWENPYFDPKEVEEAKADMPEIIFRREFGAEFVSVEGALLDRTNLKFVDQLPQRREFVRVGMGVDLAISEKKTKKGSYTAIAVMGRDQMGDLYVLDVVRDRVNFRKGLALIESMAEKWKPDDIFVEQVQFQKATIEELLRATTLPIHGKTPDGDKVSRFAPLSARYEEGLVYHHADLPLSFESELLAFPVGDNDDQVDALVYAWRALGSMHAEAGGYVSRSDRKRAPAPRFR